MRSWVWLLILSIAAQMAAAGASTGAVSLPARRQLALVIGIDAYEHKKPLKNAVADARAVGRALRTHYGFEVRELLDREATRSGIVKAIRSLVAGLREGDSLLVYYAGHGWKDTVLKEGYWLPVEARGQGDYLANSELHKYIKAMEKAQHVLIIADSCFSGNFLSRAADARAVGIRPRDATTSAEDLGGFFRKMDNRKSRHVLTSGADEPVPDGGREGHSVFGYYLLRALAAPDDAVFTAAELMQRVQKVVANNSRQTPLSGSLKDAGHEEGQMVFVRRRGVPITPLPKPPVLPQKPRLEVYKRWPFDAAEAKRRQRETAEALGVPVEKDFELARGVKITMVLIPAGEFMMGSPETEEGRGDDEKLHRVTITKPFWMSRVEVTQEQWQAVMGSNPSHFKGGKNPVEQVSWNDIQEFLKKASARVRGATLALPTEAEWEYACRAGTATPFHFGETISTEQANYDGDYTYGNGRKGVDREKTTQVGSFPTNAWGLHDMHGNVWEWCSDWYGEYTAGSQTDPAGPADGQLRVLRGGSLLFNPLYCRSAGRYNPTPSFTNWYDGFRVSSGCARTF